MKFLIWCPDKNETEECSQIYEADNIHKALSLYSKEHDLQPEEKCLVKAKRKPKIEFSILSKDFAAGIHSHSNDIKNKMKVADVIYLLKEDGSITGAISQTFDDIDFGNDDYLDNPKGNEIFDFTIWAEIIPQHIGYKSERHNEK